MGIYIITFTISIILFYVYETSKRKSIKKIALGFAVLLPCFLAGMRDVSIGTDTSGYVSSLFETAHQSNSIIDYYNSTFYYEWHNEPVIKFDFAYTLLAYFCSHIFGTFSSFLFLSEFLTIVPIVRALILYKKYYGINITLSMLMFYLLYYNTTFNAARQWLSIGFAFLALAHVCTDKKRSSIIGDALIALLFHRSGLLGILLIGFYALINRIRGRNVRVGAFLLRKEKVKVLEIGVISFLLLFSMSTVIAPMLSGVGLGRYTGYISGGIKFSINQLIYQIPFIWIVYLERKLLFLSNSTKTVANQHFELFLICVFSINAILSQVATVMENSWRVMLLLGLFNIVLFPYLLEKEKNTTKRIGIFVGLLIYLILYWYFTYVFTGRHGTVPYVFSRYTGNIYL